MQSPSPPHSPLADGATRAPVAAELPLQLNKVVLVIDLVESVRLMAANEARVVSAWSAFLDFIEATLMPQFRGRVVKSLGDGLLIEFEQARDAMAVALAAHRHMHKANQGRPQAEQMHLRAGLNATHLYTAARDVFGSGVNLAARVAGLAQPGETVVTTAVRDLLVDGLDAELEDMGECYLKHWPEPVRTWRAWSAGSTADSRQQSTPVLPPEDLRPTIAVVPFTGHGIGPQHEVVGDIIADGVITQMSRTGQMRVISRLSTNAFRGRADLATISTQLSAGYVLSGSYSVLGERVVINAELADARRNDVIWTDRLVGPLDDLLQLQSQLILALADASSQALIHSTVQRAQVLPVPQLESHALLLGGINLMHRSTARDLDRSRELLEAVSERHGRVATPWTWLAKWHVLNVVQGRSADAPGEFRQAMGIADKALDLEPTSSLALAIKGHLQCHLGTDLDESRHLLLQATELNPNDHTAWLYAGFWSTMWGEPTDAVRESERALELSPLDPQRFFIEMLVAHSYLMANDLAMTIEMCQRSLKRNRYYLASLRVLMTAQHELGQHEQARATLNQLLALQPGMTVSKFLSYGSSSPIRQRAARAMAELGLKY